jgi:putative molybdopterin biosynthesis protein
MGALKKRDAQLGGDLIVWDRDKRARLSGFGQELLFAVTSAMLS